MTPRKILIVKPSSLGDVVHSLPFLNALSQCFPYAEIHWVIAKGFEGLLEGHPLIHRLWIIKKDSWKKVRNARSTIQEIALLFRQLKQEKYDMVIDLQGLLRSGMITSATGSPVRIGLKEAREGSRVFYTDTVEGGKNIHAVDRYLKIVEYLGCDVTEIRFPFPPIDKTSAFYLQSSAFHRPDGYAVLVPGARWKTKRWPAEKFGRLASLLRVKSVIIGSEGDKAIADEIVSLSNGKAVSLVGKTELKDLINIIGRARFAVSNDSGPMHIAAALGIPVFAIFGPTDPARTGPYGKGHTIIRSDTTSCAPCFRRSCDDVTCMENISADEVLKIIAAKQHIH
jgi:lipopolysaccharide heptosyltransferase I